MKATNVSELKSHFSTNGNEFDVRYLNETGSTDNDQHHHQPLVEEFFSEQFRKPCTFSTKELADELLNIKTDRTSCKNSDVVEPFEDVWKQQSVAKNVQQIEPETQSKDDHWARFVQSNGHGSFIGHRSRISFGSRFSNVTADHWSKYLKEEAECKEWFDAIDKQAKVTPIEKQVTQEELSPVVDTNDDTLVVDYDQIENDLVFGAMDEAQQTHVEYEFSEQNPYVNISNALAEGIAKFNQGDYPGAVLCLEAACRNHDDNATAWLYLGKAHACNEQDELAIKALTKCLQLESTNLEALTTLSCSYANESEYNLAFESLKQWLCSNDKYAQFTGALTNQWDQLGHRFLEKYDVLKDVFLKAIQFELEKDVWDADLQNCLGILMNISAEYGKAADCFRTALHTKPDDAILWNRLGATLANGARYGEAIEAYRKALNILPGFVRARYNVGVLCISLKAYDAALEHFLTTLNQQVKASGLSNDNIEFNKTSDSIWQAIRTALILSNQSEHLGLVYDRNLTELNKIFNVADN